MDIREYQLEAMRTANRSLDFDKRLSVAALGLIGESGEVAEHVKKYLGHGHNLERGKMVKELGDVLWYVAETCTLLGIFMDDVATQNIDKLKARYPIHFDPELSQNRKEGDD